MHKHIQVFLIFVLALSGKSIMAAEVAVKKVFAHYMTCFSSSPEFYEREILLAKRYGIDGFVLNCGEWKEDRSGGKVFETRYVKNADRLYEAAKKVAPEFKFIMSPDFACASIRRQPMLNVGDMVKRYYDHPNQFRWKGKAVLSGFGGYPKQYVDAVAPLVQKGYKLYLIPHLELPSHAMAPTYEMLMDYLSYDHIDGMFNFACDGSVRNIQNNNALMARACTYKNKTFMGGVCVAYNSPNLRDFNGISGYSGQWESLINDNPKLIELVTWNDYNEDSNLMPYRWLTGANNIALEKGYYNRDESCLSVTSYYINWYKTGTAPEIEQDSIVYSYRIRNSQENRIYNERSKKWEDIRFTSHPFDQIHDDVTDDINITSFLTNAATLRVYLNNKEYTFKLPAGVSHVDIPFAAGVPRFVLSRTNTKLIDVWGRKEIITEPSKRNSQKGHHFANRTWITGAAAGEPVEVLWSKEAKLAKPQAQKNRVELRSGENASWKIKSLPTATYNFHIAYRNAGKSEARLTMKMDGAPGHKNGKPNYFPLYLPPTGGKVRTCSFFWTIWQGASKLSLDYEVTNNPRYNMSDHNDYGEAVIEKISIIPVKAFVPKTQSKTPNMVMIPGGSFDMGTNKGNVDEAPKHKVTVSSFAMGKYEVTNQEYEQFRPKHYKMRGTYSWRDKEPVVYVSWFDAIAYCNWLSDKYGLKKVYDLKNGKADLSADGFRLPTEAEWEYAATGRGEGRVYPWGNEKPNDNYGRFELAKSLDKNADLLSQNSLGTRVVGAYPKGKSRDGIYDLAGNVSEWLSDTFLPYKNTAQINPLQEGKSHYRVIRGGSWGYYNYTQRNCDREFNNSKYPGYIYIGFRLAISEKGYRKLQKR